jgi:probable lipoprotein NlpC
MTATALRRAAVAACCCLLLSACGPGVQPDRADTPSAAQARTALVDFYGRWEGTPYRIGGSSRNGMDCSAFVQAAYRDLFAVELPRTTTRQARRGQRVRRTRLQSGDLVFFKTGWFERHVGIYVGEGAFIHASTSQGVTRSSLANPYWSKRYWKSVRVAPF